MYGLIYIREPAPRPNKKPGVASPVFCINLILRLDRILWYTSGFE